MTIQIYIVISLVGSLGKCHVTLTDDNDSTGRRFNGDTVRSLLVWN